MNISLRVIETNSNVNGLFSQNKIVSTGEFLYITYESSDHGSVLMRFDGKNWTSKGEFPIGPPYLAVDSKGIIHLTGQHRKHRDQVWHYHSAQTHALESMNDGVAIRPKNYATMTCDPRNDTLLYFGAAGNSGVIDFMRQPAGGEWTKRIPIVEGQAIYPNAIVRDGVLHLMFTGWEPNPALYQNIFYLRSPDQGKTWTRGDGTPLRIPHKLNPWLPETVEALDRVNLSFREGQFACDTHQIKFYVDRQGRPHSLYGYIPSYFPTAEPLAKYYTVHARRDPDGWKHHVMDPQISGPSIIEDARGRLHCLFAFTRENAPKLNAGYMFSDDGGDRWSAIEPVTCDGDLKTSLSGVYWAAAPFQGQLSFVTNNGSALYFGQLPKE
ncbi:MAG: hypothetical protein EXS31_02375 [Pedosphaera sp.]|nr:hypothetical protein [Pedosphaera sp.]